MELENFLLEILFYFEYILIFCCARMSQLILVQSMTKPNSNDKIQKFWNLKIHFICQINSHLKFDSQMKRFRNVMWKHSIDDHQLQNDRHTGELFIFLLPLFPCYSLNRQSVQYVFYSFSLSLSLKLSRSVYVLLIKK